MLFELPDAKLTGNATYTAEKDGKMVYYTLMAVQQMLVMVYFILQMV